MSATPEGETKVFEALVESYVDAVWRFNQGDKSVTYADTQTARRNLSEYHAAHVAARVGTEPVCLHCGCTREALTAQIIAGTCVSCCPECTTMTAEQRNGLRADVEARVVVPQAARTLVEAGMTLMRTDHPLYKAGRAWLNSLPPLPTPESR